MRFCATAWVSGEVNSFHFTFAESTVPYAVSLLAWKASAVPCRPSYSMAARGGSWVLSWAPDLVAMKLCDPMNSVFVSGSSHPSCPGSSSGVHVDHPAGHREVINGTLRQKGSTCPSSVLNLELNLDILPGRLVNLDLAA